jgi:hypothetical protein
MLFHRKTPEFQCLKCRQLTRTSAFSAAKGVLREALQQECFCASLQGLAACGERPRGIAPAGRPAAREGRRAAPEFDYRIKAP